MSGSCSAPIEIEDSDEEINPSFTSKRKREPSIIIVDGIETIILSDSDDEAPPPKRARQLSLRAENQQMFSIGRLSEATERDESLTGLSPEPSDDGFDPFVYEAEEEDRPCFVNDAETFAPLRISLHEDAQLKFGERTAHGNVLASQAARMNYPRRSGVAGTLQLLNYYRPFRLAHSVQNRHKQQRSMGFHGTSLTERMNLARLDKPPTFRLGGCPNTIVQKSGYTVLATNVNISTPNNISSTNHSGLCVLSSGTGSPLSIAARVHAWRVDQPGLKTLCKPRITEDSPPLIYDHIYDAQFDPASSNRFMTAGNDNRVEIWDIHSEPDGDIVRAAFEEKDSLCTKEMPSRPHFIAFSPSPQYWSDVLSTYAVTDAEGGFHLEHFTGANSVTWVDDRDRDHEIASLVWGRGPCANTIFAGTESRSWLTESRIRTAEQSGGSVVDGKQASFLLTPQGKLVRDHYTESQGEVEQLAINPTGSLVACFTRTCDISKPLCSKCRRRRVTSSHSLSISPAARISSRTTRSGTSNVIAQVELPPFTAFSKADNLSDAGLVVSASWSPCGRYIAAARDDDVTDVYDYRFLTGRPLLRLSHQTPANPQRRRPAYLLTSEESRCCSTLSNHPKHGVTGMQWIQGSGFFGGEGLVTAGSDGCVRLWDIRQADESVVLAQLETSIACMNIGDISRREMALVVADSDGLVEMRTARS